GNDEVFGEEGDDLLVWNNGDGSDLLNGGEGDDTVQVNFQQSSDLSDTDLQNDDVATIADDGEGGITFNRVEVNGQSVNGLFQLDIEETETLDVNFGGGTDTARVIDDAAANIKLDLNGGDGIDTLDLSEVNSGNGGVDFDLASGEFAEINGDASDDKAANFENVIGTDGADNITGNDLANDIQGGAANDTMKGGEGDDTLVGNTGNDEVFGEEGDDLLIWNNGDGSDLLNGGEGDDTVQVNFQQSSDLSDTDLQNDDVATIADDGAGGITFNRVEVNGQSVNGLFQLDIEETETLDVNFGGGEDTARILGFADRDIKLELDGGDGVDTLDLSQLDLGRDARGVNFDLESGDFKAIAGEPSDDVAVNFENVIGTDGKDRITGNDLANLIQGGAGEDTLRGGKGDDTLSGGDDADRLVGGAGNDTLIGNKGDDHIRGGSGDDTFVWNNGDGSDFFNGGGGQDRTQVNFNTDLVNDDLQNDDVARIEETADGIKFARVEVNGQNAVGLFELDLRRTEILEVNGGGGEDTFQLVDDVTNAIDLEINGGADSADDAGAADETALATGDTLDLSELGAGVRVDLDVNNQGVLQGENAESNATREGLSEEGRLFVNGGGTVETLTDIENVIGTQFNDAIFGNAQNNVLIGGDGDDVLHPFGGTDFVDGGNGTDTLLLNGFGKGQIVDMNAGTAGNADGTGGLNTFVNIENVNGSSVAGDQIIGDAGDNVLNGLGGDDILIGGEGNDSLIGGDNVDRARADAEGDNADRLDGGAGNDLLTGGLGGDTFVFNLETVSHDTVTDFEDGTDLLDVTGFGFSEAELQDVIDAAVEVNGSTVLTFAADNTVTLEGIAAADIDQSDFIFEIV
ncbi:MAG: calcium-binding protein, partial [Pseudomonadota bacterium]